MQKTHTEPYMANPPLVIGYYPVRAKAQLSRLLCEYLHIPYLDYFLNPNEWDELKKNEARDWIIKDLPFMMDGDFVVTGSTACSYYIIEKANRLDLLGRTIEDNIKITSFGNRKDLNNAVLGLICKFKVNKTAEEMKYLKHQWATKIEPILQVQEKEAKEDKWYLGYISLIDFLIYLLITQLQQTFPEEVKKFKKLNMVKEKVAKLPEIQEYQGSVRAVKCYNPVEYFNNFKEGKMGMGAISGKNGSSSGREMELE